MVPAGKRNGLNFTFVNGSPDVYGHRENIASLLIESLLPLEAPVA